MKKPKAEVSRDNTLTVKHLIQALQDGRITDDMPIGIIVKGKTVVLGVVAHEIHTYRDGSKAFVAHTGSQREVMLVAEKPGDYVSEIF